jgi:DNA excision repair protein ERCC-5
MALAGIGKRRTPLNTKPPKKKSRPLFDLDDDEVLPQAQTTDDDDPALQLAVKESLESQEEAELRRALEASREGPHRTAGGTSTTAGLDVSETVASEASDGDELYVPGRLETALAIANAGPTPKSISMTRRLSSLPQTSFFNAPKLLVDHPTSPSPDFSEDSSLEYLDHIEEVAQATTTPIAASPITPKGNPGSLGSVPALTTTNESIQVVPIEELLGAVSDSDEDMEPVPLTIPEKQLSATTPLPETPKPKVLVSADKRTTASGRVHFEDDVLSSGQASDASPPLESHAPHTLHESVIPDSDLSDEEKVISDWSRSPSPVADALAATETETMKTPTVIDDSWDAAQEMDPHAEEGEFAHFLSQIKGKDLDDVRRDIEDEIKTLNQQNKAAMRDSEDITQQMIAQIMVSLGYVLRPPSG